MVKLLIKWDYLRIIGTRHRNHPIYESFRTNREFWVPWTGRNGQRIPFHVIIKIFLLGIVKYQLILIVPCAPVKVMSNTVLPESVTYQAQTTRRLSNISRLVIPDSRSTDLYIRDLNMNRVRFLLETTVITKTACPNQLVLGKYCNV